MIDTNICAALSSATSVRPRVGAQLPDRDAVLADVHAINGRQRCRYLSDADVDRALRLRAESSRNVVRAWGGFVANSYGWRANCTTLALYADGTYSVYRGSCGRAHGRGNTLTESNA